MQIAAGSRSHGVCKQKDHDKFVQCPQVKATVGSLIHRCMEPTDTVQKVLEDLVERTALKLEILKLCEEAFNVCIRRSVISFCSYIILFYSCDCIYLVFFF